MLEGHLGLDHDVEEGLLLGELEVLDALAPRLERVLLQAEEVVKDSKAVGVLRSLELLTDG